MSCVAAILQCNRSDCAVCLCQEKASSALSLAALASSLMEKHSQDSNQASLTLAVLEIKGLRPRKGAAKHCTLDHESGCLLFPVCTAKGILHQQALPVAGRNADN